MHARSDSGRRHSPLVLLGVLAVHVCLIVAALIFVHTRIERPSPVVAGIWLLLDAPAVVEESSLPSEARKGAMAHVVPESSESRPQPLRREAATRSPPGTREPTRGSGSDQVTQTKSNAIDWFAAGDSVARERAVAQAEAEADADASLADVQAYSMQRRALERRRRSPSLARQVPPREPSVFPEPPARVGQVIRNPDGEVVRWISEDCYVSLGSDSIALREVHAMHRGMTFCRIPLGKRIARGDLFEQMPTQRGSRPRPTAEDATRKRAPARP